MRVLPGPAALALFAGAMLPMQAAINARLARAVGSTVWAATISCVVLIVALLALALLAVRVPPRLAGVGALPWWAWCGGLCGCVLITATAAAAPRLGTASMIALVIAGQVVCSLVLDRFGLFGLAAIPLSPRRLAAAALLLAGAVLIR